MFLKYKKFILTLFLFVVLSPQTSFALDTRCWTEQSCVDGGGAFYKPTAETMGVCGGETTLGPSGKPEPVGFCLPAGQAQTQVGFSGKKTFVNFGDFIKWIYQYGIQVAAVLAVIMIIVAGIQWATSAGSSERVSSARKRIGGALMGLFLALLSYMLLNLINPYMVNLRMPQVWKINTLGLTPPYCDMITDGKKVSVKAGGPYDVSPVEAQCGVDYFVEGTGDSGTCKGAYCKGRDACIPFGVSGGKKTAAECNDKYLSIHYKADSSAQTDFKQGEDLLSYFLAAGHALTKWKANQPDWLEQGKGETQLVVMCEDAGTLHVDKLTKFEDSAWFWHTVTEDESGTKLPYNEYMLRFNFASIQQALNGTYKCKEGGKAVGFYIYNQVDADADVGDLNFYLSTVVGDSRRLVASRWGGVEGGGWFIPFGIFKDKNHFFELNLTGDMLKNMATDQDSTPCVGKSCKGALSFNIWQSVKDFWLID